MYKEIILPLELYEVKGRNRIEVFDKVNKKSILKWKVKFPRVEKIIKKVIEMQKDFIKQIKLIEIQTVCNFKKYVESRLKILYYERYFKYKYKSEGLFICKIVEEEKRIQRIINGQGIVTNQINIIGRSVKKTV